MKSRRWGKLCIMTVMLLACLVVLAACGNTAELKLTHSNGAEVSVSIETAGHKTYVQDNILYVEKDGKRSIAQLVDSTFVNERISENSQEYTQFDYNGTQGIAYENNGNYEHLLPIDDATSLRIAAHDQDFLFDLESGFKFTVVKPGVAPDSDFSSHFSE